MHSHILLIHDSPVFEHLPERLFILLKHHLHLLLPVEFVYLCPLSHLIPLLILVPFEVPDHLLLDLLGLLLLEHLHLLLPLLGLLNLLPPLHELLLQLLLLLLEEVLLTLRPLVSLLKLLLLLFLKFGFFVFKLLGFSLFVLESFAFNFIS
jgi:hypothetical protein